MSNEKKDSIPSPGDEVTKFTDWIEARRDKLKGFSLRNVVAAYIGTYPARGIPLITEYLEAMCTLGEWMWEEHERQAKRN